MRVPSPAARTTAVMGRYGLICVAFLPPPAGRTISLGGEGSNLDSRLQRTLCCRYTTPDPNRRYRRATARPRGLARPRDPEYRRLFHGLPDQKAPPAHAEEEAQEASEEDALAASSAGQVSPQPFSSGRPSGRPLRVTTVRAPARHHSTG